MKNYDNHDIFLVSAYNSSYDHDDNSKSSDELRSELSKYGYVKLNGRYADNKAEVFLVAHRVKEHNHKARKDFLDEMSRIARKYHQTSIVYSPYNQNNTYIYGISNVDVNGKEAWPGKGVMHSIGHISDHFSWNDKDHFMVESTSAKLSFFGAWSEFLKNK